MNNKIFLSIAIAGFFAINSASAQEYKHGGEMIVSYKDDVSTLDPAIGYDWQNWSMIKSIYDSLLDYQPGTTNLVNDLAESYEVTEDGLEYVFKLKQGIKFHNGRELIASDIKYSLDRVTNPTTQSPGAGFFASIEGYDAVSSGEAENLSGVKVVDEYTIKINLSRPDASFLHVMAINFSSAVPKEAVDEWGQDFGKHPVGTGAFKLKEWQLGQYLILEKNVDYHKPGLPYLDSVKFEVGQEPIVALLRLERGEVDIAGDGIPPAKFLQIKNDPKFENLIIQGNQLHTGYITLNTKIPPFDNLNVRQAVNMAINKERIVKMINGRADVANQPLPPLMPGYDVEYKGFSYDLEKAKEMLIEAGFENGFQTELYVANTDPQPRIAQAIQQDLKALNIDVELKPLAQASVIAAGGEPDQAPMIWSGGMAWIADYPDASNFYGPILGCDGATNGGWNWSWYCNEDIEKRAIAANSITDPARTQERLDEWKSIFTDIQNDAPWVPVFNEKRYTIRSERLTGPNGVFVDPVHIPVFYEQVSIK